jgi:hypothetical protein
VGRANRKDQALIALVERTADLIWNFYLLLNTSARDQSGVEPAKNLSQWQRNHDPVAIVFRGEKVGRGLP